MMKRLSLILGITLLSLLALVVSTGSYAEIDLAPATAEVTFVVH